VSYVDAVIFDWGGTLSVWADIDIDDMWRLAARHLAPDREEEMISALVAVEDRSWARVETDQHSTRLADLLAEASAEVGLDVAAAIIEEAATHHLDSWTPHVRHQPDAVAALRRLRAVGLRIGLLSNTHWPRHFHESFLQRDGLVELIDARLYTSEMEYVKPHPSVFGEALHSVGVTDPARAVFVGDRLHDDVWGARQAGLRGVWIRNSRNPSYDVTPDGVVDSLTGAADLITGWMA
jgi:putative hydrolase of the HAD superfamily